MTQFEDKVRSQQLRYLLYNHASSKGECTCEHCIEHREELNKLNLKGTLFDYMKEN